MEIRTLNQDEKVAEIMRQITNEGFAGSQTDGGVTTGKSKKPTKGKPKPSSAIPETGEKFPYTIQVHRLFKEGLPSVEKWRRNGLEMDIGDRGLDDPLLVWKRVRDKRTDYILIDGHQRHQVLSRLKKPITRSMVKVQEFPGLSDDQVLEKMVAKQVHRRNLNKLQTAFCIGQIYNARKKELTDKRGDQEARTRDIVAKEFGLSATTVSNYAAFHLATLKICKVLDGQIERDDLLMDTDRYSRDSLVRASKLDDENIREAFKRVKNRGDNLKQALDALEADSQLEEVKKYEAEAAFEKEASKSSKSRKKKSKKASDSSGGGGNKEKPSSVEAKTSPNLSEIGLRIEPQLWEGISEVADCLELCLYSVEVSQGELQDKGWDKIIEEKANDEAVQESLEQGIGQAMEFIRLARMLLNKTP